MLSGVVAQLWEMEQANQARHDELKLRLRAKESKVEDQGNALERLAEHVAALEAAAAESAAAPPVPPVSASADLAAV